MLTFKASLLFMLAMVVLARDQAHVYKLRLMGYTGADITAQTEQVAYDDANKVAYLVGGDQLYVVDLAMSASDLATPPATARQLTVLDTITLPHTITDVVTCATGDYLAVSTEGDTKVAPGLVHFLTKYQRGVSGLMRVEAVTVGSLPDQITFSKSCNMLLVSNEGEPDGYSDAQYTDPEGSVSVINLEYCKDADKAACGGKELKATVRTAGFKAWNNRKTMLQNQGVKINGPNATVAQDLEPEYTTFSEDETTAFVSLQENNAIALLDIGTATFTGIYPLGFKNHNTRPNSMDASDKDGKINIQARPVWGMWQPDEIASYRVNGVDYIVTANEGDARDWPGLTEEARFEKIAASLAPGAISGSVAEASKPENLGRLTILADKSKVNDRNGDGLYDRVLSFGARSFSILSVDKSVANGNRQKVKRVFDSRNQLEMIASKELPELFNSEGTTDTFDGRSDNKGPEPEGLAIGRIDNKVMLFLGCERLSAVFVYDITDPIKPVYHSLALPPQTAEGAAQMVAPEGIAFAEYTYEISGTKGSVPVVLVAFEGEEKSGMAIYAVDATQK